MAQRPSGAAFLGTWLVAAFALATSPATAHSHHHARAHHARYAGAPAAHVIQCVAFARADSDVQLPGNAANWWDNAAGVYARGAAPEVGSVLNFRANARMRLGHVAVVSTVINPREVLIDQSHWNRSGVSRAVSVIDVSPDNDWSAVRVAVGREAESYGSIYPTYGFIYPRPDNGVVVANASSDTTPMIEAPALRSLRVLGRHRHEVTLEVAEAPENARAIDLSAGATITDDAPDRAFR